MDYSHDDAVSAALLGFGVLNEAKRKAFIGSFNLYDDGVFAALARFNALTEAQRKAFTQGFNEFIYVSSQRRRYICACLVQQCQNSPDISVRQVAESAAVYMARAERRRRPRRK